ncbi:MAG: hypothetical protein ACLSFO_02940 [Anaerovoracaceae bacterium]
MLLWQKSKKHRDATHNAGYGHREIKWLQWASDDGEPQEHRELLIIKMLTGAGITNVAIVVCGTRRCQNWAQAVLPGLYIQR